MSQFDTNHFATGYAAEIIEFVSHFPAYVAYDKIASLFLFPKEIHKIIYFSKTAN